MPSEIERAERIASVVAFSLLAVFAISFSLGLYYDIIIDGINEYTYQTPEVKEWIRVHNDTIEYHVKFTINCPPENSLVERTVILSFPFEGQFYLQLLRNQEIERCDNYTCTKLYLLNYTLTSEQVNATHYRLSVRMEIKNETWTLLDDTMKLVNETKEAIIIFSKPTTPKLNVTVSCPSVESDYYEPYTQRVPVTILDMPITVEMHTFKASDKLQNLRWAAFSIAIPAMISGFALSIGGMIVFDIILKPGERHGNTLHPFNRTCHTSKKRSS